MVGHRASKRPRKRWYSDFEIRKILDRAFKLGLDLSRDSPLNQLSIAELDRLVNPPKEDK